MLFPVWPSLQNPRSINGIVEWKYFRRPRSTCRWPSYHPDSGSTAIANAMFADTGGHHLCRLRNACTKIARNTFTSLLEMSGPRLTEFGQALTH